MDFDLKPGPQVEMILVRIRYINSDPHQCFKLDVKKVLPRYGTGIGLPVAKLFLLTAVPYDMFLFKLGVSTF